MIPDEGAITKNAEKRLEAIQTMEELGSGLLPRDARPRDPRRRRGARREPVRRHAGGRLRPVHGDAERRGARAEGRAASPTCSAPLAAVTEINLHVPALLPPDYCDDVHERLTLYKRLANCDDDDALTDCRRNSSTASASCRRPARALIETHRLRLLAQPLGVKKIDASGDAIVHPVRAQAAVRDREAHRAACRAGGTHAARRAGPAAHRREDHRPRRAPAAHLREVLQGASHEPRAVSTLPPHEDLVIQGPPSAEALDIFVVRAGRASRRRRLRAAPASATTPRRARPCAALAEPLELDAAFVDRRRSAWRTSACWPSTWIRR